MIRKISNFVIWNILEFLLLLKFLLACGTSIFTSLSNYFVHLGVCIFSIDTCIYSLYGGGGNDEDKENQNDLKVGNCYETFQEVYSEILNYCEQNFHPIKVSRSEINDSSNSDYKYSWVTYICQHGGKYKPKGKGLRINQTSFAVECPLKIHVRLINKPMLHYKITQLNLTHNHEIGQMLYGLYPKQRRLNDEERNSVKDLVLCNVSNKDLRLFIQEKTNKNVTSYDIRNLRQQLNGTLNSNLHNSELLINELNNLMKNDTECNIHLETDQNNVFQFLLIQTKMMKLLTQQFSSVLFIDATYKVNIEGFPLYTIMCEDANGIGRPLCYTFVRNETTNVVKPAIKKFIDFNPIVSASCKVIVTDKDLNAMNIIKELFPSAINILCIFHVLKYWRHKVSNLDLNNMEKETIRLILKQLIYSDTEEIYYQHLERLKLASSPDFFLYFLNNWDNCKEKYVLAFTKKLQHLGNTTNNRVESHNQKIKAFLKPEMHLCTSVKELLNYIKTVKNSLIHSCFKELKCISLKEKTDNTHAKFAAICTHKACNLIFNQINKFEDGTFFIEIVSENFCRVISKEKNYDIENLSSCTCSFYCQYILPCQHVFAARFGLNKELFDENLISRRWVKPTFSQSTVFPQNVTKQTVSLSGFPQTGTQKFSYARIHTDRIATILSQCGAEEFQQKIKFLSELLQAWENNEDVLLCKRGEMDFEPCYSDLNGKVPDKATAFNVHEYDFSDLSSNEHQVGVNEEIKQMGLSSEKLIIPSVKHRRGRAKNAFPPYNIPRAQKTATKSKINDENKILGVKQTKGGLLTDNDYKDLISNQMLNDSLINAGQTLIKSKFPHVNGLQNVLLGAMLKFKIVRGEFVQILHCGRFPHWIAVSNIGAPPSTIYIYDSLNEPVPRDAVPQICNIMDIKTPQLITLSKSTQTQPNGVDCGLFALANTYSLLNGENPSEKTYDTSLMRKHFASCLVKGSIEAFPTVTNNTCRSLERLEIFDLNCLCRQPIIPNTSYNHLKQWCTCNICKQSYHKTCKVRCCIPVD